MSTPTDFQTFWNKTGKILDGKATEEEHAAYHQMLLSHPEFMDGYIFLKTHWSYFTNLDDFRQINTESDWIRLRSEIAERFKADVQPKPSVKLIPIMRAALPYAAAVAILISIAFWFYAMPNIFSKEEVSMHRFEAPLGSRAKVMLPDETEIWLNAGSMIEYSNDFNKGSRQVKLIGEAFFDVSKRDVPFVVNTSEINIRVLGTTFNIKAYAEDEIIETTLVTGSLLIERATDIGPGFDDITLQPKQKAIFHRRRGELAVNVYDETMDGVSTLNVTKVPEPSALSRVSIVTKQDVSPEVGWKDGVLVFDTEPLGTLVRKLERRYNVVFRFDDESMLKLNYTGRIRDHGLEQVLQAMKLTSPIVYAIEDKMVTLSLDPGTSKRYKDLTQ
jgi:transmembrane sensor